MNLLVAFDLFLVEEGVQVLNLFVQRVFLLDRISLVQLDRVDPDLTGQRVV